MPVELAVRDIVGMLITGAVIIGVAFSPVFKALGHRIMHGKPPKQVSLADDPRVDDLSAEVAALREQLDATQERLDFTERLLAQAQQRGQLGAGGSR